MWHRLTSAQFATPSHLVATGCGVRHVVPDPQNSKLMLFTSTKEISIVYQCSTRSPAVAEMATSWRQISFRGSQGHRMKLFPTTDKPSHESAKTQPSSVQFSLRVGLHGCASFRSKQTCYVTFSFSIMFIDNYVTYYGTTFTLLTDQSFKKQSYLVTY